MDEPSVIETTETEVRQQCLDGALRYYEMQDKGPASAEDVTNVAGLFEDYIQQGMTVAIVCHPRVNRAVR